MDTDVQYVMGNGGVRIGYGLGPFLGINVAVPGPTLNPSAGVYLSPVGVVNAASSAPFTASIARGELITLYGSNLSSKTQTASGAPFPPTLNGVQVLINNVAAPLYYVSPGQVSAIVPYETDPTSGIAQVQVVNGTSRSNAVTTYVGLTAPGVFTNPAGGLGYAAALHANYSLVSPSSPAQVGETISVFVTGLGDVFPGVSDGTAGAANPLSTTSGTIASKHRRRRGQHFLLGPGAGIRGTLPDQCDHPEHTGYRGCEFLTSAVRIRILPKPRSPSPGAEQPGRRTRKKSRPRKRTGCRVHAPPCVPTWPRSNDLCTILVYTGFVATKNITFSAPEETIEHARTRARQQMTKLNEDFLEWLDRYAGDRPTAAEFDRIMASLKHVRAGRKFTRDEMNER